MAKIAFVVLPAFGHVNPTLGVVRELVGRGHEVEYWCSNRFRAALEQEGAGFRGYRDAFLQDFRADPGELAKLPGRMMGATERFLRRELDGLREGGFDLMVHDSVAPWGKAAAEVLGLPAAGSVTTFAFTRKLARLARGLYDIPFGWRRTADKLAAVWKALRIKRRIRREFGVSSIGLLDLVFAVSEVNVVYTSRRFQPYGQSFGPRFHFVGVSLDRREDEKDFPRERLQEGRPVLYISLGTIFNLESDFYRMCFAAFGDSKYQVVMTLGGGMDPSDLPSPPGNFILCRYAPQLKVLERADAAITRGGMNTVSECLAFGVPVVAIPATFEQAAVAGRTRQLGAGEALKPGEVTVEGLREKVAAIDRGRARESAREIGESLRAGGGAKAACDAVLSHPAAFQAAPESRPEAGLGR